jgi:hypothetical protein
MSSKQRTPAAAAFDTLRKAIAKERGLKLRDPVVQRLALLTAQHNRLAARIISGSAVATSELLAVEQAMKDAEPPLQHRLEIQFVTPIALCPKCHYEREKTDEDRAAEAARQARLNPPRATAPAQPPASDAVKPQEAPPTKPDNVVPLKSDFAPARNFHDGAPVKGPPGGTNPFLGLIR